MKWSLKLGVVAGIGVYMHWSFLLLIGWMFLMYLGMGQGLAAAMEGAGFILAIFACVVLHEFGHALTAQRFGIRTRDITLLPIGGVARLERMPERPFHEFLVALAGPAVNLVIAILLWVGIALVSGAGSVGPFDMAGGSFSVRLMWVNVFLLGFNLLPAFPMDGGRVLRALLATRLDYPRATQIAASVGQVMAILFGIVGFLFNPLLIFIAIFVYLGAQAEAEMVGMQAMLQDLQVRDAMATRFRSVPAEGTLADAVRELLAGAQQDFPVVAEDRLIGLLTRKELIRALADTGGNTRVDAAMRVSCRTLAEDEPLRQAFDTMRQDDCGTLPVLRNGQLVGLLTMENISEILMLRQAAGQYHHKNHQPLDLGGVNEIRSLRAR